MAMEQPVHSSKTSLQLPFLKAPQKPVLNWWFPYYRFTRNHSVG